MNVRPQLKRPSGQLCEVMITPSLAMVMAKLAIRCALLQTLSQLDLGEEPHYGSRWAVAAFGVNAQQEPKNAASRALPHQTHVCSNLSRVAGMSSFFLSTAHFDFCRSGTGWGNCALQHIIWKP